jgi:hypothetical protein
MQQSQLFLSDGETVTAAQTAAMKNCGEPHT